jgi:ABC-type antimicrobial peptide transport system permease subunit
MFLYVRTSVEPQSVIGDVKNAFWQLDARVPFFDIVTMREQIDESLWQERLLASLSGLLAICSILMAAAGLYGLLAYDTSQRTREFGIRVAVGATTRDVVLLLLKETAHIVLPGIAAGLFACLFLARIVASALYGISPFDPLSIFVAFAMVVLTGILALWQPLHRAMRIDPAIVLRDE